MATEYLNKCKGVVTYEQFGAVGDGKTEDFAAIMAAHEYANEHGLDVHATAGKVYYINSTCGKSAIIKTNTHWNGATFIFDDSNILAHKSCGCKFCLEREGNIFKVESSLPTANVLDAVKANLPILSSFDGNGTKKFENWPLDYDALVHIKSDERKVFIRMGANADEGDSVNEIILVHKDGTISETTPVSWNYTDMTSAVAYNAEDEPIIIDGGGAVIQTIANRAETNDYFYYARNILVHRSNVRICNFEHKVEEEQEFRAPYKGILRFEHAHNVTYENIVLQAARRKYVASNNQQGTYEIGGYASNAIKFFNVNASNFFATGASYDYNSYGVLHKKGEVGNRGMMGSNYCRNFHFEDCRIVNIDSHKGMGNLTVKNCELQCILVMGAGKILIKDTTIYADRYKTVLLYRSDYGASFRGDITLENVEVKYSDACFSSNPDATLSLITLYHNPNNDYDKEYNKETGQYEDGMGSTNYMATNLYIKGLKMTKYHMLGYVEKNERGFNDIEEEFLSSDAPIYVFNKNISCGFAGSDKSKFASDGGHSDKNRHIPPETIVIENSYKDIVLPSSTTFKNNTKVIVDGEEVSL